MPCTRAANVEAPTVACIGTWGGVAVVMHGLDIGENPKRMAAQHGNEQHNTPGTPPAASPSRGHATRSPRGRGGRVTGLELNSSWGLSAEASSLPLGRTGGGSWTVARLLGALMASLADRHGRGRRRARCGRRRSAHFTGGGPAGTRGGGHGAYGSSGWGGCACV